MTESPANRAAPFTRRTSGADGRFRRGQLQLWALLACLFAVSAGPAQAQAPVWTVTPSAFEQNMSVVAVVSVGGVRLSNAGDRVAAFVGAQVRGVVAPTRVGGANVFFLPVYASTGGERVTFKAYDAAAGVVRDLSQTLAFAGNAVHGGATDPLVLTPGTTDPPPGGDPGSDPWRVDPSRFARSMSVVGELRYGDGSGAGVGDRVAAFVGGEVRGVASSVAVDGRRVFFLPVYANTDGDEVTFKVASGASVRALGGAIAFATDAVTGAADAPYLWTVGGAGGASGGTDDPAAWTASPAAFDRSMNVVAALFVGGARSVDAADRVAAFVGGEVRGVAAPREVGGTWLAFLTVYGRVEGEAVSFKVLDASTGTVAPVAERLVFTTNAVSGTTASPFALTALSSGGAPEDPRLWAVNPAAYEQSMSTVGALFVQGVETGAPGSRVAAFVRGSVRGVVGPSGGARPLFFVPVSGGPGDVLVSYKAFDAATGRVYETAETGVFESNRVSGRVDAPVALHAAATPTSLFVYPGDGNGDARVTQNDLFPLSFYFGLRGPARATRSLVFRSELVAAWSPAEASLADMNGDGQIDQNDLFALGLNFGRSRAAGAFSAAPSEPVRVSSAAGAAPQGMAVSGTEASGAATIRGIVPGGTLRAGDTLRVAVVVAAGGPMRGAGFRLAYDAAVLEPMGRLPGALFGVALGEGSALEIFKRSPQRVSYAVTVAGTGAVANDGEVAVLRFRVRAGAAGTTVLRFDAAEAMQGSGTPVLLTSDSIRVSIASSTGTGDTGGAGAVEVDLGAPFPNPSAGRVQVRLGVPSVQRVRVAIYDLTGRRIAVLYDGVIGPGAPTTVDFDGSGLASGVYVVRADAASGSAVRRLVLQH